MDDSMAISVHNVSKMYRLFTSPKHRLMEAFHPFRKKYHHEFWALKDISFDVPRGSTLGIIGRNGSGKSTLLQIICSVLAPTSGVVDVKGKISALLELGSGFNPEFTGRDNVIFNGALMGFSRPEMEERLPEIESFADIGEFFYQPVKTYSSGMFVRLAFAAAISVDPDILIVDEALAVGDVIFQRKCFRKFNEFKESGKTIVFVSHDLTAISRHCSFAIVLDNGSIDLIAPVRNAINRYWELIAPKLTIPQQTTALVDRDEPLTEPQPPNVTDADESQTPLLQFLQEQPESDSCALRSCYHKNEYRYGDRRGEIVDFFIQCNGEAHSGRVRSNDLIELYMKVRFQEAITQPNYGFKIRALDGLYVHGTNAYFMNIRPRPVEAGEVVIFKFSFRLSLGGGDYFIGLGVGDRGGPLSEDIPLDRRYDLIHIKVESEKLFDGIVNLESGAELIEEISSQEAGLSKAGR